VHGTGSSKCKRNSRQLFQIVKSMTPKFQARLQCIESKIQLKLQKLQRNGRGIVKTRTIMKNGKKLNNNIRSKSLHHFIQRSLILSTSDTVGHTVTVQSTHLPASLQTSSLSLSIDSITGQPLVVGLQTSTVHS